MEIERNRNRILFPTLILLGVAGLYGCGDDGDTTNTSVNQAGTSISGIAVEGATSTTTQAVASRPALLHILDDNGKSVDVLDADITDSTGAFSVRLLSGDPGTRFAVEVQADAGSLFNFVTSNDVSVSPATNGVYTIVGQIVGTPDGRSVDDYTPAEIDEIDTAADSALTAAGTNLLDEGAIKAQLLTDVGRLIADRSGGGIAVIDPPNPVTTNPADVEVVGLANVDLLDGGGELWDIRGNGSISDGTSDSYDTFFTLTVGGTVFPTLVASVIQDDKEVVHGPAVNLGATGLDVTRKVYVDDTAADVSFARFLDILENPTAADITLAIQVGGNLGSDEGNDIVAASSSGDTTVEAGDIWLTNHQDSGDPALGFFFPGASDAVKVNDNIDWFYNDVTIPAGGRVTLVYWGFQNTGGDSIASTITSLVSGLQSNIPAAYFAGLSQQEVADSWTPHTGLTVIGEAGAVAPGAVVTLNNTTAASTEDVTAQSDGSFSNSRNLTISPGDVINITATDGIDITVNAP